jgi:hypothetical protein
MDEIYAKYTDVLWFFVFREVQQQNTADCIFWIIVEGLIKELNRK